MKKPNWKHRYASHLEEAIERCAEHPADKLRQVAVANRYWPCSGVTHE
ncbi:hypothetical protein [Aquitalea aquatica]|uniref:Uncharacterized protein n=1 Tax=Aquitalea aquatica TaxID=3044273 RepID=A0A838YFM3_9NEIS|nr:hypothetical protein [Aquitalea magnusonii]MBA4709544.1 hypothetical protein [Aquitalea magnusonii]